MPRKTGPKMVQFTIALPAQTLELMRRLDRTGYYTPSRSEVARQLILDQLKHLGAPAIAEALKKKPKKRKPKKRSTRTA